MAKDNKGLPVFRDLDAITAQTESRNRDYDEKGRPVTSPKGARFAMQVMPATARDPGFGLKPANPNDPKDMNRLGREYRAVMEKRYGGDLAKMWAAYNAGPGAVDNAVKKYGSNWLRGMPAETRNYVQKNLSQLGGQRAMPTGNTSAPGQGIIDTDVFLASLESKLAPESKASGGVTTTAQTIYNSDGELQKRAQAVESELANQGNAIDVLTQVTDAAQAVQIASLTETVNETRAISNEIVKGTETLKRQVQPVFEARGRIADQLDKVTSMNPLERTIRGIFDLNYDRKFLKGQLDEYDRTLQMRANDYDYVNKLHERAMTEIDRRYRLDNALPELAVEQATEDLGIVGMRIQQTAGMLGSLRDRISGEVQLISAKAAAREDMLSRIDAPTVLELATQAKNNNGVVAFNGVEFSYAELRDRAELDEQQELQREIYRNSVASGRMDIAEKTAINLARSLTRQQAEAALANGGVYNGIQLPQDVLANVYQNHIQTANTQAQTIANTLPTAAALRIGSDAVKQIRAISTRTREMFGGAGMPGLNTSLLNGANLLNELVAATERGESPEVIQALTQRVVANSAQVMKDLDQSLLNQAGGNKQTAGYLKSFVLGAPLDSATSVEAIAHFAVKGGLPQGIGMTPEARSVFQFAQKEVAAILKDQPKISQAALLQRVGMAVNEQAAKTLGQARFDKVTGDLPVVAKSMGNPLGKLSLNQWRRARDNAKSAAVNAIAGRIGATPEQVRKMQTTGAPLDKTPASEELYKKFVEQIGVYNATEQMVLIRELDELPSVQPGMRNSEVAIEFLRSPALQKGAKSYQVGLGQNSMGDYLLNPVAEGALEGMLLQDADGLATALSDVTEQDRRTGRQVAAGFQHSPLARTSVILSTIPGVGKEGAKALLPSVAKFVRENDSKFFEGQYDALTGKPVQDSPLGSGRREGYNGPMLEFTNSRMVREDQMILNYLQSTKFEDPSMEAWRKAALKGWNESSTQANSFMGNLMETFGL